MRSGFAQLKSWLGVPTLPRFLRCHYSSGATFLRCLSRRGLFGATASLSLLLKISRLRRTCFDLAFVLAMLGTVHGLLRPMLCIYGCIEPSESYEMGAVIA